MREQKPSKRNLETRSNRVKHMEIRNRKITGAADTATFQILYNDLDVKRALAKMYEVYYYTLGIQAQEAFTKEELLNCLEGISNDLRQKYSTDLAEWGFNLAIRRGYITQVAPSVNLYRFSEKIVSEGIELARKRGTPY